MAYHPDFSRGPLCFHSINNAISTSSKAPKSPIKFPKKGNGIPVKRKYKGK